MKKNLELSQYKIKFLISILDKELEKSENLNRTLELIQILISLRNSLWGKPWKKKKILLMILK